MKITWFFLLSWLPTSYLFLFRWNSFQSFQSFYRIIEQERGNHRIFHSDIKVKPVTDVSYNSPTRRLTSVLDDILQSSKGNSTEILLSIVRIGDQYQTIQKNDIISSNTSISAAVTEDFTIPVDKSWEKVQGCMSNVWLRTYIMPSTSLFSNHKFIKNKNITNIDIRSPSSSSEDRIILSGIADSRVSRGLLALVIQSLSEQSTTEDILNLRFTDISTHPTLQFLPTGRLNGLINILKLIQAQVSSQLESIKLSTLNVNDIQTSLQQQQQQQQQRHHHRHDHRNTRKEEVAVLLSGGVDSSLALHLIKQQGYKVKAYYLKIWLEDELAHLNECPWEEDLNYAQAVANNLGVELEALSLQKEYWKEVVAYTLAEARLGRTPNPDIMCNSRIKFGMFYDYVGKHYDYVATGHYAQAIRKSTVDSNGHHDSNNRKTQLVISPDAIKDQTYFLSNLRQDQLSKALFPIGHLTKSQVRDLAKDINLPTQARKDSQGICFLGKLKFEDFVGHYLGDSIGDIRDYHSGEILGYHKGLWYHTIGQRKGIGPLLLPKTVHKGPYFVVSKDMSSNTLYVTNNPEAVQGPRKSFTVNRLNWISDYPVGLESSSGVQLKMKLRHSPSFSTGIVKKISRPIVALSSLSFSSSKSGEMEEEETLHVELDGKDTGLAPGQFTAFYELWLITLCLINKNYIHYLLYSGNICLGAGVISETSQ